MVAVLAVAAEEWNPVRGPRINSGCLAIRRHGTEIRVLCCAVAASTGTEEHCEMKGVAMCVVNRSEIGKASCCHVEVLCYGV